MFIIHSPDPDAIVSSSGREARMSAELHKIEDAARLAMADFDTPDSTVSTQPNAGRLTTLLIVAAATCLAILAFAVS